MDGSGSVLFYEEYEMMKKLMAMCVGMMSLLMLAGCDATEIVNSSLDLAAAIVDAAQ
jgi:ABC-type sulfate transport system substrate-binding protein